MNAFETWLAGKIKKIEAGGGGGGGSGVLVAHATVDGEDLGNLSPENPVTITIDKTFAELWAEDFSVIKLDVTAEEGQVVAIFWFTLALWAEPLIFLLDPNASAVLEMPYALAVTVDTSDGATVANLKAIPASGGGDGGDEP